jgi:ABC-type molybdenum transport system ATPase subunit/photorepair protein PhrA
VFQYDATYRWRQCQVSRILSHGLNGRSSRNWRRRGLWRGSLGLDWKPSAGEKRRALGALDWFGLAPLAGRYPREVSYGQLRLALLARALIRNPELLLLDEPFTGLDRVARTRMLEEMERRAAAGTTLVLAVHHTTDIPAVVQRELVLRGGRAYFPASR